MQLSDCTRPYRAATCIGVCVPYATVPKALEPLISRTFVDDMTKDSDKHPEIAKLDDSYFQ